MLTFTGLMDSDELLDDQQPSDECLFILMIFKQSRLLTSTVVIIDLIKLKKSQFVLTPVSQCPVFTHQQLQHSSEFPCSSPQAWQLNVLFFIFIFSFMR